MENYNLLFIAAFVPNRPAFDIAGTSDDAADFL